MPVSREVHLVLHGLEELLCRFCPWVIVYAERIDFQYLTLSLSRQVHCTDVKIEKAQPHAGSKILTPCPCLSFTTFR